MTTFLGALGTITPLAEPDERAALLSAYLVQSYLAFSLPAVLAGASIRWFGYLPTADIYAAVTVAICLCGLLLQRLTPARPAAAA